MAIDLSCLPDPVATTIRRGLPDWLLRDVKLHVEHGNTLEDALQLACHTSGVAGRRVQKRLAMIGFKKLLLSA